MKKIGIAILLVFLVTIAPTPVQERGEGIKVLNESASFTFAKEMVFEIAIEGELKEASLFYQIEGELAQRHRQVMVDYGVAKEVIPLQRGEIPPAAKIAYFWRLEDSHGYLKHTEEKSFLYLDQRFPWQSQTRGEVTLFWYGTAEGLLEFDYIEVGEEYYEVDEQYYEYIFAQIDQSLTQINERLGLSQKEPLKIVAYHYPTEMAQAYQVLPLEGLPRALTIGQAWGHHTFVFCFWFNWDKTLTHELTHLLTHQLMGGSGNYLPFWLSEGLATYAEESLREVATDPLSMSYLSSYPTHHELADPAYAQAQSIVTFLVEERGGKEKIHQLLTAIAEGATVDDALLTVYSFDQEGLGEAWLEWFLRELAYEPLLDVSRSMAGN